MTSEFGTWTHSDQKKKYSQTLGRWFFPRARERGSKESKRDDYCNLSSFVNTNRIWCIAEWSRPFRVYL
uniref:T-cell leukemia/lymphoma 6 n=1 Tax=Caenorhabditis tropicalis TaxID=1561998 RepID=A0A1I7TU10_9PELO